MRLAPAVALLILGMALAQTSGKRADLDGVWILLRAQVGTLRLTPDGEKKRAAYDFRRMIRTFNAGLPASPGLCTHRHRRSRYDNGRIMWK